jgi:tetratricopeptide (TPR) repeat protein
MHLTRVSTLVSCFFVVVALSGCSSSSSLQDKETASALIEKADNNLSSNNTPEALESYRKAQAILESTEGVPTALIDVYGKLFRCYMKLKQPNDADGIVVKQFELVDKNQSTSAMSAAPMREAVELSKSKIQFVARSVIVAGDRSSGSEAEQLYQSALRLIPDSNDGNKQQLEYCDGRLAELYFKAEKYADAISKFEAVLAVENAKSKAEPSTRNNCISKLSYCYLKMNRDRDAEKLLKELLITYNQNLPPNKEGAGWCLRSLAGIYAFRGNNLDAKKFFNDAIVAYRDSLGLDAKETRECIAELALLPDSNIASPNVAPDANPAIVASNDNSTTNVANASGSNNGGSGQSAGQLVNDNSNGIPPPVIINRSVASSYIGGSGHWISENHDGEIITLEDGSVWQVDSSDVIDSNLWLPTSSITVVDSGGECLLINTDDKEKVGATLLHY